MGTQNQSWLEWHLTRCRLYWNKCALKHLSLPRLCCSKGGEVEEKMELEVVKSCCCGFYSVLMLNISNSGAATLLLGQNDCLGGVSNLFFPFLIKSLMFQAIGSIQNCLVSQYFWQTSDQHSASALVLWVCCCFLLFIYFTYHSFINFQINQYWKAG